MTNKEDLGPAGQKQFDVVMSTFHKRKLRGKDGKTITDRIQAIAIAFSEGRSAEARGTSKRTWKGRSRIRPRLKEQ